MCIRDSYYKHIAIIYCKEHDFSNAFKQMKKAIEVAPDEPVLYYLLGIMCVEEGSNLSIIDARVNLRHALELNPDYKEAQELLDQIC